MARHFDASTEKIDFGSGSDIDDLQNFSLCLWMYIDTFGNGDKVVSKVRNSDHSQGWALELTDTNEINFAQDLDTTDASVKSSDSQFTTGKWICVCVSCAIGSHIKLWTATAGNRVAEVASYGNQNSGSGSPSPSDADGELVIGQRGNDNNPFRGKLARFLLFDAEHDDANFWQAAAYGSFSRFTVNNYSDLLLAAPLEGLFSPEPDISGKLRHGTVTGATRADNPPTTLFSRVWPDSPLIETAAPSGFAYTQAVIIA